VNGETTQRLVKACPVCGCSELYSQTRTRQYRCTKCKHVFPRSAVVKRAAKPCGWGASHKIMCEARMAKIHEYHEANPDDGKYKIMAALHETYVMVTRYMESVKQTEAEVRA
jgi:hypothetical protein